METECQKPTKKYPNGRAGTQAGISAHRKAKEKNCEACAELKREHARLYREKNKDKKREIDRLYREKNKVELKAKKKEYHKKNAEAIREKNRKWREENKERVSAYSREYRKNNPEKCRAYSREYRKNNPENVKEQSAKYRKNNPENVKEQSAKWREENRDSIRAYSKEHYRKNPERWEGYDRKRRALIASQPHEPYTRAEVAELHGTVCYLCGGEVDMSLSWGNDRSPSMDHLWPLNVPGGPGDVLSNMWVTHAVCNIRKGDRMVEDLKLPFAEPESRAWDYATIEPELV